MAKVILDPVFQCFVTSRHLGSAAVSFVSLSTRLDHNLIDINKTTGALILAQQPDAEDTSSMTFKATCLMENVTFTMMGSVNILDINDNAPTTQLGNTTAFMKLGVKTVSNLYV
ncbi:hypothetical protein NPIL_483131 [Nephila pilipes]|uniref:Cadherin domain-containing protein n=2 Tax=Nephila pilipes TaxID=299642 RepID=A0A8X6NZS2_NEPPI|nr:hypothetical protein NPIL_483131 [Nephila pilipes]